MTVEDTRRPYGEPRFVTYGEIDGRVHVLVFTVRAEIIQVISPRKANDREIASYERQKVDIDADSPPLTDRQMARMRPTAEILPELVANPPRVRGKQKMPTKVAVSVRLDADVIDALKKGGPGWQSRLNDTLRSAVLGK